MGYLNKVQLIGRLGQDPEKRSTPGGHDVVNFSMATSETYKDKSGNKQEKTEWHKCQAWGNIANVIYNYTSKGSQIYVEGSLQTREWQDKNNEKRYTTEIVVRSVQLLDSKSSQNQQSQPQSYNSNQHQEPPPQDDILEDGLPF